MHIDISVTRQDAISLGRAYRIEGVKVIKSALFRLVKRPSS